MKRRLSTQRIRGLTLVEVLVSIVVVAVAAGVFIPYFSRPNVRICRVTCTSKLMQVGLGMRIWSNDHDDKFPWRVSTNQGGTMEFANTAEVFGHYLALSNELSSPKVLKCGLDEKRSYASSWDPITDDAWHISYFVGLDADEAKPLSILSGDRNLTTNGRPVFGAATVTRSLAMGWTGRIHTNAGNIGFGDGSAQQFLAKDLQAQFQSAFDNLGVGSMRLVIP